MIMQLQQDNQKRSRLQKMLNWRLEHGTTPYHEAEASALVWALEIIDSCTNGNGNNGENNDGSPTTTNLENPSK